MRDSELKNAKDLASLWHRLGTIVISTVMADPGALIPCLDTLGHKPHWFPRDLRPIWQGISKCHEENMPPTVEAVAARSNLPVDRLRSIADQWDEDDAIKVAYHAKDLKRLGTLAEIREVGRELSEAYEPGASEQIIDYAISRLSGALALQTNRTGDAHAVGEGAWQILEEQTGDGITTGLGWFDDLTGGIWPGLSYWVAGAYKSGKTTLMRNVFLNIAQAGVACDIFCAEGSREMFALDCQAMMATRLLCERGERVQANLRLSGLFLRRVWRKQLATFRRAELAAINDAREKWNTLNIRVWDTVDGIRNLTTLKHRIQSSKFEYGSRVAFLDYSQLFGEGQTLFDRQSRVALALQEIATGENVAIWTLTQRNESAITAANEGYSAGIKGGGDAAAAADFLLMPMIDATQADSMTVKLKHSRHSGIGSGTHVINPSSGLIIDPWFQSRRYG